MRAKLPWVRRKLAEFEALGPPPAPKRFVAGELLPYLGRDYRLDAGRRPGPAGHPGRRRSRTRVRLDGDAAPRSSPGTRRERASTSTRRSARYVPLVGAAPAALVVRDLGRRRWGVCDHRTLTVSFHWQLVTQPPDLVDYVVVHELAHLHEPNHGPAFWSRVEDVLPDCKARRKRLSGAGDALTF